MFYINREQIVEKLLELSDIAIQYRRWLSDGENSTEVSSFTEAVCGLFDDSGLGICLRRGTTGLGAEIDINMEELDALLEQVSTDEGPLHTIQDPVMNEVRMLAARLLGLLETGGGEAC
jgi:hypothetical protein